MIKSSLLLLATQQTIYNTLTQDAQLMSKVSKIYDRMPNSPTFPYILVEGGDSLPVWTMTQQGEKVSLTLNVYGATAGYDEAKEIMGHLERILINQSLIVQGYGESICEFESSKISYVNSNYLVSLKVSFFL